ncbi:uncharacterized protein LOC118800904 [Colossoma macropomum]|uniref:uncharacterized protein LOC118800904 n=1 Tax=Colossoma macropomum TaxID=42526 RepID=UPI0018647B07|nr:uncharacterized protein LOC118800904 [Colossoma macropomum]
MADYPPSELTSVLPNFEDHATLFLVLMKRVASVQGTGRTSLLPGIAMTGTLLVPLPRNVTRTQFIIPLTQPILLSPVVPGPHPLLHASGKLLEAGIAGHMSASPAQSAPSQSVDPNVDTFPAPVIRLTLSGSEQYALVDTGSGLVLIAEECCKAIPALASQPIIKISCKYTTADSSRVRKREWYQFQNSDGEERVLSKDPEYSARVSVRTEQNDCDLTVRDVRVRDSGVYNFRFRTSSSDWISASSGVNLTVTELQVKVDRETAGERKVKVICSSTCSLDANLNYDWYRNEVYKAYTDDAFIVLDSTRSSDEGSYSCQVEDSSGKRHRSPSVCVLGKECWGVTYTPERVCALKGSSVDLSCSYYPGGQTVTKSVWFIKEQAGTEPVDVREDEEYQGRVQYRQSSQNDCSIRINQLRKRDAQTYIFRFYTDGGEYTGQPGVTLFVTGRAA